MGVLFHESYKKYPEVWRGSAAAGGETKAIAWSSVLAAVTCTAFVWLCVVFGARTPSRSLELAVGVWLAAPVPLLITNALFIKLHRLVVLAHALGWLARLCVAALAVSYFLAPPPQ